MSRLIPSQEELNRLFYIDENFKLRNRTKRNYFSIENSSVGSIRKDGYLGCKIKQKYYLIHRIVGVMVGILNGLNDERQIDHIDGNRANNNPLNLRAVFQADNNKNQFLRKDNKTGVIGVSFYSNRSGNTYFESTYYNELGKLIRKRFSIEKLGEETAFRLACQNRNENINELVEKGFGYTLRHGENRINNYKIG